MTAFELNIHTLNGHAQRKRFRSRGKLHQRKTDAVAERNRDRDAFVTSLPLVMGC